MKSDCEGNCEGRNDGHRGEVKKVVVSGGRAYTKPTTFRYCEQAIEEDRNNGFTVEEEE